MEDKNVRELLNRVSEVFMLIFYLILLKNNFITLERLIYFLLIICIICGYLLLFKIIEIYLDNYLSKIKEQFKNKEINENNKIFNDLIYYMKFLSKLSIIINPILYFITLLNKKLVFFFR